MTHLRFILVLYILLIDHEEVKVVLTLTDEQEVCHVQN